jgi:hypothetical protein
MPPTVISRSPGAWMRHCVFADATRQADQPPVLNVLEVDVSLQRPPSRPTEVLATPPEMSEHHPHWQHVVLWTILDQG